MKIYCAGHFEFEYRNYSLNNLAKDYRGMLIGDPEKIAHEKPGTPVTFKDNNSVEYIGPFYFYEDKKTANDIVSSEMGRVEEADVIFFYIPNNPACPGTVTEMVYSALLGKKVVIAYEKQSNTGEPENDVDSPVWYPLMFASLKNRENVTMKPVENKEEAVNMFKSFLISCNK